MVPFGETILLWRLERRLSQADLAKRAGITRPNLSAIESGKREVSLKTLRALADALGLRPGILADGICPFEARGKADFSREALERIADGVVYETPVHGAKEKQFVGLLQSLMSSRLSAERGGTLSPVRRKRTIDRAWLQLSSGCPPQVIESLIQRISDKGRVARAAS